MKTFKLFNFNRRTAMVQAEGCTHARQKIGVNPTGTPTFARFASGLCLILTMLFTLGVGQMWGGESFWKVDMTYSFNGTTGLTKSFLSDDDNVDATDLGTMSSGSFTVTKAKWYCWANWQDNTYCFMWYNIDGGDVTNKSCYESGASYYNNDEGNHYPESNYSWTIANSTDASGSYTLNFGWYSQFSWGSGSNTYDIKNKKDAGYQFTYKIAPPAVSDFTITPSGAGYVKGSGTSDDPYIMKYDEGNLVLTISGSQAHTDANSSAKYYNGSSWSTTATKTIAYASGSTTKQSITLKMKYNNSTASLDGAVSERTVWYQRETAYNVRATANPSAGGNPTPSSLTATGQYSGISITAPANTGYTFSTWSIVSGGAGTFGSAATTASNTFYPTKATDLKATFTAKNYTVKLSKNGGDTDGTITTTYNSTSTESFTGATYAGHSCDGYFTAKSGGSKILNADGTLPSSSVASYLSSGNWVGDTVTILYAQWTEDVTTYTVNYGVYSSHTSYGSLSCATTVGSSSISSGDEVASGTGVTFTASPISGYEVDAWYRNSGCTSLITEAGYASTFAPTITKDTTVYVKFKKKIYTVTYSPSSAPTGCTYTTTPTTGTYGNTVTMVITPSTGYTVSVSAVDASSNVVTISNPSANTYTFTQPASAVTVTVTATEIPRDITIEGGTDYSSGETTTTAGVSTKAKVVADAPAAGKKFTGWTLGDGALLAAGYALTDRTIEVNATADATVTANYADRAGVKMYFAKPTTLSWSKVYAYAWKSSDASIKNATYPGIELEDTEVINCVTYYIYQYYTEGDGIGGAATGNSEWNKIVFGDNNDARKTGNLNIADGHYYYRGTTKDTSGKESAITSAWYIKGTMNSWGETDPIDHNCVSNSGSVEMTLTAGNTYEFKVYNEVNNQMWSNSTAMGGENPIQGSMVAAQTLYNDDEEVMKVKTAKTGTYIFRITSTNTSTPALQIGFPDLALAGTFNSWNTTANEFVDGVVTVENLAANTDYEFKVVQGGAWFGCTGTITTSEANWVFYNPGDNCVLTTKEAGTYVFGWNTETHVLTVIYPNDQPKMKLTSEQYLYFDASKLTTTGDGWNKSDFTARFWLKHYATGADITGLDCTKATATALEENIYYVKLPANNNIGQVQLNRLNPENLSDVTCTANKTTAFARSNASQNCLKEETGKENYCNEWTPQWTTYCPPIRTSTLSDNSTTKITWQSSGGAGTSENPYLVSTSHSIKVQGAATQVVNDVNMTINYDFKVGGSSQQASASNTYSHTSLSNNTTYTVTMDSYNAFNDSIGTKNTSATALYYKALDTYTVTNDLTNISSNGRSGAHAAAYNIAYSATLSVSAGYSLPTTITIMRGSSNITASCTYNSSTGALTIPAAQMTGGDITITAAGVAQPLTFTGETTSWSTASNWSPNCVPTIEHDVTINKHAVVDIEHAAAKSIVLNQYSGNTGKLTIQANKGLEVEGTIRVKNAKNKTVVTTPKDLVLQSSSAGNATLIFANTALDDRKDSATVYMYSKAEIPGSGHWNWQYIGLPFESANATYTYYGSYIHKFISNAWAPVANGETLYSWQGYSITNNSATTYEMEGELVSTTDDVEIELSYGKGKLIGNSWTAPINIESFTTSGVGATFTSTPATIYLFNTGNTESASVISLVNNWEPGQYISIPVNSASSIGIPYIAPMQGFWISADTKAGSVTLKYDELVRPASERAIVAGAMRAPKREQTERPQVMKIFATGARYSDRVTILSREDFSRGFDNGWDGERMTFCEEAPSIYVINGQGSYDAVSSIPEYEGTVIGFRSGTNNMATISFDYDGEETLYLNDLRDQTSALISNENTYEFSTSANDDEARFIISATPIMFTPTAVENNTTTNENKVQKIIFNDRVYIIRNGRMYDATGVLCK